MTTFLFISIREKSSYLSYKNGFQGHGLRSSFSLLWSNYLFLLDPSNDNLSLFCF